MSLFSKKGLVTNRLFRKEIRIIRIILSEIICFFKNNTHFWSNYDNYSNFFPKTKYHRIFLLLPSELLLLLHRFWGFSEPHLWID